MKTYVIKRDDGKYCKDQLTSGLRFVSDLLEAGFYGERLGAESTMQWIINNEWRYHICERQVQVVAIEIKEIQEQE